MEQLAISRRRTDEKVRLAAKSTRSQHPYLSGNYWPQPNELHLTLCEVVGDIPSCLSGGQFVRNGPNSAIPPEDGQSYHMFDGDGMIHGVYFKHNQMNGQIEPLYINKFVRTDVYLASRFWGTNLLPSIASMIDPMTNALQNMKSVMRSAAISFLSGSARLSTANTALVYHDNRLLATCESGPPMHIGLPELETVAWHTFVDPNTKKGLSAVAGTPSEWITGHPKVDPISGELVMFGIDIFQLYNPYIRYSVINADGTHKVFQQPVYLNTTTPKMMHDFAITQSRAVILDLPLTMSPFNIVNGGKPMLHFDHTLTSKFGILPRNYNSRSDQAKIVWFEGESCMIFHTANAWDDHDANGTVIGVNLVACRFKGAKLVFAAGGIEMPVEHDMQEDVVHLYYYRFDLLTGKISHEYPLSNFPIEYPSINTHLLSLPNKFVYGASMREGSFDTALSGAKVDVLIKCDVSKLILDPPQEVKQSSSITPPNNVHVKTILLPRNKYASEATFVPFAGAGRQEDEGVILVHVYDERTMDSVTGDAQNHCGSEVWILDAQTFSSDPVCIIKLPQRVPYGLHGLWVSKEQLETQRDMKRDEHGNVVAATKSREETSVWFVTSFWKWSLIWVGRSTVHGVSTGRHIARVLISWIMFVLLSWRLVLFLLFLLPRILGT